MIRLGTSGFSYDDWIGPFYPQDLPRWGWLGYYGERFNTVELNVTYYRLPEHKIVAGWVKRTPDDFLFAVKAHKSLTHEREQPDYAGYLEGLAPLVESSKLACVLAQFPHSFHATDANRAYLAQLREGLSEVPVVAEFRDQAWVSDETFGLLRRLEMGFCCVDEPRLKGLMPPVALATAPVAYVRFHGRNAAKWWRHEHAWERYDYTYAEEELETWVPRIRELAAAAPLTLVYANNHYKGQSVDTIRKLENLLAAEQNSA
jgi:uncharacterized protein YecE (DUF72 family)